MARHRGLTLLEIVMAAAIFVVMLGGLYTMIEASSKSVASTVVSSDMDGKAREVLDRLAREIEESSAATFNPAVPLGSGALTFQRVTGYAGGALTFGPAITFGFAYEFGESDNGLDDNGNRRIDEGVLTRTEGGASTTLCRDLREGGIRFTRDGSRIDIALTLDMLDERGRVVSRTYQTSVSLRN